MKVVRFAELVDEPRWAQAFAQHRKDRRFFELIERTVLPRFDHHCFVLMDGTGEPRAFAPFFILDQDLLAGAPERLQSLAARLRGAWPGFLTSRTLMVGCAAGEGHLDDKSQMPHADQADRLAEAVLPFARENGVRLVVFKEFPSHYRAALAPLTAAGYTRVPSMPMTELFIGYADFDEYIKKGLTASRRSDLRRKFRATTAAEPIQLSVLTELGDALDEVYPLYLNVYERSKLRFEKLTPEFFRELGRTMPDKVRFFVWRQHGQVIAFSLCMIEGDAIYAEYLGLDYRVALHLHLYHYAFRDVVSWGMAHGCRWFRSSGLNYDPKLHLGSLLHPLDLYVRHTSPILNSILRRCLPLMEPTRSDPHLRRFPNYDELWGRPGKD